MTTMDSDSASQDSDDGRRFRFEATRKDSVTSVATVSNIKLLQKISKHKSQSKSNKDHQDKPECLKSNNKINHKNCRYSIKHNLKHKLRNLKQEDNKISQESHQDNKDVSIGSVLNDRDSSKNCIDDTREKSQDLKWQTDKNRNVHCLQQSREYSYDKNHHDDRHRSRYHERYKHSGDKSRNRSSHHSNRFKFSNSDHCSQHEHGLNRHDLSTRKTTIKENKSQNCRDHSSSKNAKQIYSHSNVCSNQNLETNPSIKRDIQDCKKLSLSDTDEKAFNNSNSGGLSQHSYKIKQDKNDPKNQSRNCIKLMKKYDVEPTKMEQWKESSEMKQKNNTKLNSSLINNNNSSTIATITTTTTTTTTTTSTSNTAIITTTASTTTASTISYSSPSTASSTITIETYKNSKRNKSEEEKITTYDSTSNYSSLEDKYSRYPDIDHSISSNDAQLLERDTKQSGSTYGPHLPPGFMPDTSERISPTVADENKIDENGKMCVIGPCLSPRLNKEQEVTVAKTIATTATKTNVTFGPALPPHLLQQRYKSDSQNEIIGPTLPTTVKLCEEDSNMSLESDNDDAIGPLPVDHPALKNNYIYEQLNMRAQEIRSNKCLEMIDAKNQREKWMIDLPSIKTPNLGLSSRKFKLREGPDILDRSCWTDTPIQKAQKQKDLELKKYSNTMELQNVETKCVKAGLDKDRKHKKSLLEMHQKEIAKRKKTEEKEIKQTGIPTRRPFDRNIDLEISFDQTQKKSILLKAQKLDDRFSHGQI